MMDRTLAPLGAMARIVHVSTRWLRAEAEAGRIPAIKAGERLVFRPDIVIGILAEQASGSSTRVIVGPGDMARILRVPVDWVYEEAKAGRIPHINAKGHLIFNPGAVQRVLAARAETEGLSVDNANVPDGK